MDSELLIRFLTKKCSESDTHEINKWISSSEENAKWLFGMEDAWSLKDGLKYSDKREIENAWKQFTLAIELARPLQKTFISRTNVNVLWKYCAAAVVAILLITNIYLTLSQSEEGMNTINVPLGQYVSLSLSDGTKVWLNAGTQFTYPSRFSGKNRNVEIIGEGFFEVTHKKKSHFIVQSGNVKTKVLGTKFNVKAYQNEQKSIALVEGIVEVSTNNDKNKVELKPNEKVDIPDNSDLMRQSAIDAQALSQWISGELCFINEPLKSIVATLERKYDVEIETQDELLENIIFDSRIKKDATLTVALNALKETRKLNYTINGRQVYLYHANQIN